MLSHFDHPLDGMSYVSRPELLTVYPSTRIVNQLHTIELYMAGGYLSPFYSKAKNREKGCHSGGEGVHGEYTLHTLNNLCVQVEEGFIDSFVET